MLARALADPRPRAVRAALPACGPGPPAPRSSACRCATIWNTGATRNARNRGERHKPAQRQRRRRARICRAPMYITVPPTMPISTVAERLISDMAVSDRHHVVEQALHAAGEHARLLAPRRDSPSPRARRPAIRSSRPVTSALILPRSRKIGRILPNALLKPEREHHDEQQRDARHQRADPQQDHQREQRRQHAADEIHQARCRSGCARLPRRS